MPNAVLALPPRRERGRVRPDPPNAARPPVRRRPCPVLRTAA